MRHWRAILCFLFGVVLAAHGLVAFAETISATATPNQLRWRSNCTNQSPATYSANAGTARVIQYVCSGNNNVDVCNVTGYSGNVANLSCHNTSTGAWFGSSYSGTVITEYSCPAGQNWTLSGTQCTRPDCVAPQTRQADGTCAAPCASYTGTALDDQSENAPPGCTCPAGSSWYKFNGCRKTCAWAANETINGGWAAEYSGATMGCYKGCQAQGAGSYYVLKNGNRLGSMISTGWACGSGVPGSEVPADTNAQRIEDTNIKDPNCAPGDGVVTSSSGSVKCLPAGVPNTSIPKIEVKKVTETYPDASNKVTTTTTTTDPYTGATYVHSTATGSGGSAGSGTTTTTSGTSTSSGAGSAPGAGGDGACDPKKDFCGGPGTGGLYEKKSKTVAGVVGEFKTGILASGIGSAATGFFTVTVPGGACPSWVVNVAYLNTAVDLSQYFCTATAINMMNLVGAVLFFVAGFVGFRWAIL